MKKNGNVIILGAGPIGLITGWLLAKKNWNVKIFEKNSIVGGMCRSWKWSKFIIDTGPHIFHTPDKKMMEFWKNNFGHLLVKDKFWAKNTYDENFSTLYNYPFSVEGFKSFNKTDKQKILKEIKSLKKGSLSTNFDEHVKSQVGPTLAKMFFKNYPEKIWGISTKEMTAEWAPKRISFRKKIEPFYANEYAAVGKYGTGSVYEYIKNKFLKNKGKIFLNHTVKSLNNENHRIKKITFTNNKELEVSDNTIIISSLPITLTSKLLGFKSDLKFRGVRTAYIAVNKKRVLPKKCNWIYYSSKEIIFNRISEHKTMTKYISPSNKTYLSAEIAYSKNDKIDKLELKELRKKVVGDLIKTGLISNEKEVFDFSDNKEDFVYPVQFTNYKYELSKTFNNISKFRQLYSLGTGGEFNYADSQILFHKSMDLVNILCDKHSTETQVQQNHIETVLNKHVVLGKKTVGDGYLPYIIAEAGLNHNGDVDLAKKLIDEAIKIKCDSIKFQTFTAKSRISKETKSVKYAEEADGLQENIYEMFERLSLNEKAHREIFSYAKKRGIEIFSTPFDEYSVNFLDKLGVNFYKVASVDLVNLPLIKRIGETGKPLILSTGMGTISLVEEAVECFKNTGNKNLILLHCLSSYPANEKEMNLNAIKTLKTNFNIPVGLSDHFPGLEMSYMSLALGANIIERHFTLNKTFEGPDHILSSEPEEFKQLMNIARNTNSILGDGQKKIQPSEYVVINSQRKSIYASKKIKKGEKFSHKNLCIKGPGGGILPKYLNLIIGKSAKNEILEDFPIEWKSL
jgi:sialic acid synthase SpsE/protoporphyrinogen oxidase